MYVYLLKDCDKELYKIGFSKDPKKRIKQLQTGNGSKLELVASYQSELARKIEKTLHRQHTPRKVHNEWFELTIEHVNSFIADCELTEKNLKIITLE